MERSAGVRGERVSLRRGGRGVDAKGRREGKGREGGGGGRVWSLPGMEGEGRCRDCRAEELNNN